MLDEAMKPWIMEINLSPSLSCDSPLDFKIKETAIVDLFNMIGFQRYDRKVHKTQKPAKMPIGRDEVHDLPPPNEPPTAAPLLDLPADLESKISEHEDSNLTEIDRDLI